MDFSYQLPAASGMQAGKNYYITMVPIRVLEKIFSEDAEDTLPSYSKDNIQQVKNYLLSHRTNYVMSAFTAAFLGKVQFYPASKEHLGVLEIAMDAKIFLLDGKVRKEALVEAFHQAPQLGDETIPILLYPLDSTLDISKLRESFQMAPSNLAASQILVDKNALAVCTQHVIQSIPFLSKYTDMHHATLGIYSAKLFLFRTFLHANRQIFKRSSIRKDEAVFLFSFWSHVTENMLPWQMLERKEITKLELRRDYLVTQSVILKALGLVGKALYSENEESLGNILAGLQKVDWRKQNPAWQGRMIADNGVLLKTRTAILSVSAYIKKILGIPLSELETNAENFPRKKES